MGSINCKQFAPTTTNTHVQKNESTETYHSKCAYDGKYVEEVVCRETDIEDNEMKEVPLGEDKVLLIKQKGQYSAIGRKCTHYGALLSTGALGEGRIRCPWHGACFNIQTGDIEDFPGLDSLPCHQVIVKSGEIRVRAKKSDLEKAKRIKDMVKKYPRNETTIVVIGGGPSGGVCVETLRQEGFTGRIVLICKEDKLPYDRIKLSKAMDIEIGKLQFREQEFYDTYGIETLLGVEVNGLDTNTKEIQCSNGYKIKYDKVYIATGSTPARPNIPGVEMENIFTLRDHKDAEEIYKVINSEMQVVCLGSSFISLEAAAYCVNKVKKVTAIGRGSVPLKPAFGDEIGKRILRLFEENGVTMIMNSGIKQFIGSCGKVTEVILLDGTRIPCDVCILGTGSHMNTGFLKNSSIPVNPNGSVDVDMHLMTCEPDVFVGGDIANAPVYSIGNNKAAIGHYQLAQYHGRIAALNMTGNNKDLKSVPFFWTVLFGKSFRYSGYGQPAEVKIEGSLEDLKFVAMFFDSHGNVIGMASCMRDPVVAQFAELQNRGRRLHKNDLKDNPFGWAKLVLNQTG